MVYGLEGPLSVGLSTEIVERLNNATVGQNRNEQWYVFRKGRITLSNFHSVSCKIKNNKSQNIVRPLLSNIMVLYICKSKCESIKIWSRNGTNCKRILSAMYEKNSHKCCF